MLIAESGDFDDLGFRFEQAAGYPEWLAAEGSTMEANSAASVDRLTG
jgi:hypothetical protein